jgi:polar amino acid transport system substrate-binding protein
VKKILSIILLFSFSLYATETIKVGIKYTEPWVMYDKNVSEEKRVPRGFSIDLWNAIAQNLGLKTQWLYYNNTTELVNATKNREVNSSIAAITINSNREKTIDFSASMYELGLQVMVNTQNSSSSVLSIMAKEVKKLITTQTILLFILFLLITIHLRWFVDRQDENSNLFPKNYFKGIYESFWWGITMLVTWETPRSKGLARTIDLLWHITGLISLSILTAIVTASLTANAVGGSIKSHKDLAGKYVAAVATDAPRKYLEKLGANVIPVKTLQDGIDLILNGKAEALVHDGPRIVYLANKLNKEQKKRVVTVFPFQFNPQNYGIIFPTGDKLRERVNQELLKLREPNGINKSYHDELKEKWIKN